MSQVTATTMDTITKKSSHRMTPAAVNVCITPGTAFYGPVPVPYANQIDAGAAAGNKKAQAKQKEIVDGAGQAGLAPASATQAALMMKGVAGDAAGSAPGVVTGGNKRKLQWMNHSYDVKVEGQNAVRFLEVTRRNP